MNWEEVVETMAFIGGAMYFGHVVGEVIGRTAAWILRRLDRSQNVYR